MATDVARLSGIVRIAFLLVRHPPSRQSPIVPEIVRLLEQRGADVELMYPDQVPTEVTALRPAHDLYVLKSGSEVALSLAGALHAAGACILNPYPVAVLCRDKIVVTKILEAAGVPTPKTFFAARAEQLAPLLEDGPLVVKPHRGSQGRGVRVVRSADELIGGIPGGPLLAQRFHEPDGPDLKIYAIGAEVFGVERNWPARTYTEKVGRPFVVEGELRELALRCGSALGVSLFGFDVVMSHDTPYVVDVSSFPGFKGVPLAAERLARYIEWAGPQVTRGEPLLAGLLGREWVRA